MTDYTDRILSYCSGEMSKAEKEAFRRDLSDNFDLKRQFLLQGKIDRVMKQSLLLEAIENDPDLIKAEILSKRDIEDFSKGINQVDLDTDVEFRKQIAKSEIEMVLSGIDNVSEVWVRNFDSELKAEDERTKRIRDYISESTSPGKVIEMPRPIRKNRLVLVGQIAAAAVVITVLVLKTLLPGSSNQQLYSSYYEPLEVTSFTTRSSTNTIAADDLIKQGISLYLSKDYAKAHPIFETLILHGNVTPETRLYAGLNAMGEKDFTSAIGHFNNLLSGDDQYVPETQWYLSLCYVQTGDILKAKSLLESLSSSEGMYKKKAQDLLKKLKK